MTGYPPTCSTPTSTSRPTSASTPSSRPRSSPPSAPSGLERDDTLQLREFPTLNHVAAWIRAKAGIAVPAGSEPWARPAAPPVATSTPGGTDRRDAASLDGANRATCHPDGRRDPGHRGQHRRRPHRLPADLLDPDLDLEADLGVDTVKQAEVFAAVRAEYGLERDDTLQLRDFPTLNHVAAWIRAKTSAASAGSAGSDGAPDDPGTTTRDRCRDGRTVRRHRDRSGRPRRDRRAAPAHPRPVLRPAGAAACRPASPSTGPASSSCSTRAASATRSSSDWARPAPSPLTCRPAHRPTSSRPAGRLAGRRPGCGRLLAGRARRRGRTSTSSTLAEWTEALRRRVKTLYATMRRLWDAGPFLVSATRLGGRHGYGPARRHHPLGGAVTGFTKSYRKERPDALVKAVDLPASRKTAAVADMLIEETLHDPGCVEVGRLDGRRCGIAYAQVPFPALADDGSRDGPDGMPLPRSRSSSSPARPAASSRRSPPTSPRRRAGPSTCSTSPRHLTQPTPTWPRSSSTRTASRAPSRPG